MDIYLRLRFSRKSLRSVILLVMAFLVLGMIGCGPSKKIVLDLESREFYEKAQLIMTKEEKKIFEHLPDKESREEFIEAFWARRDPEPYTEENEFKIEFFKRIEYANQRFKEGMPGWKTDRGRIYVIFGPPDKIERNPFPSGLRINGYQVWVYYDFNFAIEFVDKRGNGTYTFDPYFGVHGEFFDALEEARLGKIFRTEGELKQRFVDFKAAFDPEKSEIIVSLPINALTFRDEEGLLKADFQFDFFVYEKEGTEKKKFSRSFQFEEPENKVLEMKNINFRFSYEIEPGEYYFDVTIISKAIPKTRKIFEITVKKEDG